MYRILTGLALVALPVALLACSGDVTMATPSSYCDDTGCFACRDSTHKTCWALSHPSCKAASQCAEGSVCTSIGCCTGCHGGNDCRAGEYCTTSGYCSPVDVAVQPIGTVQTPTPRCQQDGECGAGKVCNAGACATPCATSHDCPSGLLCDGSKCRAPGAGACGMTWALCLIDADCGSGRTCWGGKCHLSCGTSAAAGANPAACPVGEACSGTVCLDAAPARAECLYDLDCGPAARCINSTCHPLCARTSQCGTGEICDSGVCRADYRPAR